MPDRDAPASSLTNGHDETDDTQGDPPGPERMLTTGDVFELFLRRADRCEPLTAPEIAERVGVSRPTAYDRLQELVGEDRLRTKEVGARGRVYWLPEEHI